MLKKVLCLLLVLAFTVALFACGDNDNGTAGLGGEPTSDDGNKNPSEEKNPGDTDPDKELIDDKTTIDYAREQAFFSVVNNSRYNLITTKTETSNPMFEEVGPCIGFYETAILGEGDYSFYYWAEHFNRIGEGSIKSEREPHTILYKGGEYFYDGVKVFENPDPNALNVKLELDPQYLGSYSVSEDGTLLTAKISASELEYVLGVNISATSTVDLTVEIRGTSIYMITVDYSNNNDSVHIETSYTYRTDMQ